LAGITGSTTVDELSPEQLACIGERSGRLVFIERADYHQLPEGENQPTREITSRTIH
jgi:hypothetical protein